MLNGRQRQYSAAAVQGRDAVGPGESGAAVAAAAYQEDKLAIVALRQMGQVSNSAVDFLAEIADSCHSAMGVLGDAKHFLADVDYVALEAEEGEFQMVL